MAYESKTLENVLLDENSLIQTVPKHGTIQLDNTGEASAKYFYTTEEDDGKLYAGVYGEEITYDGVGEWGDTDFTQLTNGTIPDVNGGSDVRTFHGVVPLNIRRK